ncbi:MAG: response regulator [Pseudonocardiales bacterium]|nr:response regulator [Pseudonocardiales bacterium]
MDKQLLTISQELAEVGRLAESDDVSATLDRYVTRVVRTVPGCDHACISVASDHGTETIAGAWPGLPAVPERGPALTPVDEVLRHREPRRLDDVETERRWPAFAVAMRAAGFRSCLSLPLAVTSEPAAAFTLLSDRPNGFGEASFDIVLLFTLHAGAVFDNASLYHDSVKLVEQLRTSLRTRTTIGQAQGLLMHRYGYDTEGAFTALREASQHHNTKLREVAAHLVDAHSQRTFEAALEKYGLDSAGEAD